MTNQSTHSASRPAIVVPCDSDKQAFHDLAGVFSHVFLVVCGQVRASGQSAGVTYCGEHYTIAICEAAVCHH